MRRAVLICAVLMVLSPKYAQAAGRLVRAFPVDQVTDRRHNVTGSIEHLMGAELLSEFAALGRGVDGDDARAHDYASCVADKPTGPWPKTAIVSPP